MPNKPHKWGIKAWALADSHNGYVWLYTGTLISSIEKVTIFNLGKERDAAPEKGLAHNVVMGLVAKLVGRDYHVYTDNFYSSPQLFAELKQNGFHATGTLRTNRKGISKQFQEMNISKGEVVLCKK